MGHKQTHAPQQTEALFEIGVVGSLNEKPKASRRGFLFERLNDRSHAFIVQAQSKLGMFVVNIGRSAQQHERILAMSDEPGEGLDRRDFMVAAVGASAALAANSAAQSADQANTASRGTVYTGDVIDGKKVISALNIDDLEPGKKHLFYFQGVQMVTGQHWYVSVMVAKGARPGKRIALVSGVHGDEISSVRTLQTVMDQLDPPAMSGAVLAVLDVSRPAIEGMARRWPNSRRGIDLIDMNREWPGNENGPTAPSRHAGLLFNRLLRPNADYAMDFHTGTTGMDVTAFHLARMDLPEVRAMAELFPIDQIFDNPLPVG